MPTLARGVLLGLTLVLTAGAALADAAQDCQDEALTSEERETACEKAAAEAGAYEDLAFTHLGASHPEEALVAARRALEIAGQITQDRPGTEQADAPALENFGPTYERAQGFLLQALVETGSVEEAFAAYREGLAAGIEDAEGHLANDLAWGLYRTGEHARALPVVEDWLAAHPEPPDNSEYHIVLDTAAHIMAAAGQTEKAVETFLRAAEIGGMGQRILYKSQLTALGFVPETDDDEGFEAALRACVATGEACRLY